MTAWTDVKIANVALALIGSRPIQTFDDSTPSGAAVNLLYPFVTRGLFAGYPWVFARDVRPLDELNEPPLPDGNLPSGWSKAFALPADLVGPPEKILANARMPDGPLQAWEIQNATVYTNQLALWCVGQFMVDEAAWPDYFVTGAVKCLAAELYPVITGNGPRLQELQVAAYGPPEDNGHGGAIGMARRRDAAMTPSRKLSHNPLIDVRTSTTDIRTTGALYP